MIRVYNMSADAQVSDAARAPVDIMLPMHVHFADPQLQFV